jgi:hypothetical protein
MTNTGMSTISINTAVGINRSRSASAMSPFGSRIGAWPRVHPPTSRVAPRAIAVRCNRETNACFTKMASVFLETSGSLRQPFSAVIDLMCSGGAIFGQIAAIGAFLHRSCRAEPNRKLVIRRSKPKYGSSLPKRNCLSHRAALTSTAITRIKCRRNPRPRLSAVRGGAALLTATIRARRSGKSGTWRIRTTHSEPGAIRLREATSESAAHSSSMRSPAVMRLVRGSEHFPCRCPARRVGSYLGIR